MATYWNRREVLSSLLISAPSATTVVALLANGKLLSGAEPGDDIAIQVPVAKP